jgi:hypothetical protein
MQHLSFTVAEAENVTFAILSTRRSTPSLFKSWTSARLQAESNDLKRLDLDGWCFFSSGGIGNKILYTKSSMWRAAILGRRNGKDSPVISHTLIN